MIPPEIDSFLHERTGNIKHSGRTLYDHLKGTHDILEQAKTLNHVCWAGLFHSIYGTNVFRSQAVPLEERAEIRRLIGKRAEDLAYVFCACNRPQVLLQEASHDPPYKVKDRFTGYTLELTVADLYDLLTIELANLSEQKSLQMLPQMMNALIRVQHELLSDMRSSVSPSA